MSAYFIGDIQWLHKIAKDSAEMANLLREAERKGAVADSTQLLLDAGWLANGISMEIQNGLRARAEES